MIRTVAERRDTLAELLDLLGGVPLERILSRPAPGTATEKDVERLLEGPKRRLCELVHGVLVEKAMGLRESRIGGIVFHHLENYSEEHGRGTAFPADGALHIFPGLIYIPDVSFILDEQLPDGEIPEEAIPDLFPDLAVEVLSKGNTKGEMQRKLRDYFRAGAKQVWLIDPKKQIVDVYTSATKHTRLTREQTLDGGDLLPGFELPVKTLFARRARKTKGT